MSFVSFLGMAFASQFTFYILVYWGMILVSHLIDYYTKFRERELRTAQLETGLRGAAAVCSRVTLQPHFLFNTLNAISSHPHRRGGRRPHGGPAGRSAAAALKILACRRPHWLASWRSSVPTWPSSGPGWGRASASAWMPARTPPRRSAPTFLLQPLVENAIRYGVAPRSGPGCVEVRAWRDHDRLHLEVRDDGPGLSCEPGEGVGLSNTGARLYQLYGTDQRLDLSNDPAGGCVARITLPFREHAALHPAPPGERRDE